jgi:hypothetical protein
LTIILLLSPLPQSFQDLLVAAYHFNVKQIFMLGPLKRQADKYWPEKD